MIARTGSVGHAGRQSGKFQRSSAPGLPVYGHVVVLAGKYAHPQAASVTPRSGFEVRAATPADAPGLAPLLATVGKVLDERALADRLGALHQGAGTALVATQWGPPSGLVVLHRYQAIDEARPTAQITMLLVGAEDRRRGLGRLLIKAAAQAARSAGCGQLELLTTTEATSLREFCRATGFAEVGLRLVRSLRKQG